MKKYKFTVAFTAVETVNVFADNLKDAKDLAIEELHIGRGLDIVSGSYEFLESTYED